MQLVYRDIHTFTSPDGTRSDEQSIITHRDAGGYSSVEELRASQAIRQTRIGHTVENIENGIHVTYDKPHRVVVDGWITETSDYTLTLE